VIAVIDPEPLGKAIGVGATAAGPIVIYGGYHAGEYILQGNDRAIEDPPDPHFKKVVKPIRQPRIVIRPGKNVSRGAARGLSALANRHREIAEVARVFAATVDKLGGARQAGDKHFEGVQARAAIKYARQVAVGLERLVPQTVRAAKWLKRLKGFNTPIPDKAVAKFQRRAKKKLPKSLTRSLRAIGFDKGELSRLKARIRKAPPALAGTGKQRTLAALVTNPELLAMYEQSALALRYWALVPQVTDSAALE
jgi:hypothetical protein